MANNSVKLYPQDFVAAVASILVFIASFLPWLTLDSFFGSISQNGINYDRGIAALVLASIAILAITMRNRVGGLVILVCGIIIAIITLTGLANLDNIEEGVTNHGVKPGVGLIIASIGGVALALSGIVMVVRSTTSKN